MGALKTSPISFDLALLNEECKELQVEFSWRPLKCDACNNFGHVKNECKNNVVKKVGNNNQLAYRTYDSQKKIEYRKEYKAKEMKQGCGNETLKREKKARKVNKVVRNEKELYNRFGHLVIEVVYDDKERRVVLVKDVEEANILDKVKKVVVYRVK